MQKGASWPLYAAISAYAMNTFASTALQGLSPFELVFARKPQQLTSFEIPKITSFPTEYRGFFRLLGGLSLHLNHLIASRAANYDWPFGTLPFGLFGSNLDTRDLETYPRTYSGHF